MPGFDELKHFPELDQATLVSRCLEGDESAWNELFRRFMPMMTKTIATMLRRCGYSLMSNEDEPVGDISEEVYIKLRHRGGLSKCVDPSGLEPWLKTVTYNQVIGWIREQNRMKTIPTTESEKYHISLDEPVSETNSARRGDVLAVTQCIPGDDRETDVVGAALRHIDEMEKNNAYWVMRLSILAQESLGDEECEALASFTKRPMAQIHTELAMIMARLEARIIAREKTRGQAVILWYKLRRLERRLYGPAGDPSGDDRKSLLEKIAAVDRLRQDHLKASSGECRPSNKEIAQLLGLPEKKVGQVSVILLRVREKLRAIDEANS